MQDRAYVVGWCKVVAPTADVALASEALHPFDTAAPASDVKKYVDELKLKTMLLVVDRQCFFILLLRLNDRKYFNKVNRLLTHLAWTQSL